MGTASASLDALDPSVTSNFLNCRTTPKSAHHERRMKRHILQILHINITEQLLRKTVGKNRSYAMNQLMTN